jgi:hypothetical protein
MMSPTLSVSIVVVVNVMEPPVDSAPSSPLAATVRVNRPAV